MLIVAGFGWAKPVPVNPFALSKRSSSAGMLVALAGPLSNFLLAIIAAIPLRAGLIQFYGSTGNFFPTFDQLVIEFIVINLALMLFNLIPIAPLDGEKVISDILPPGPARVMERIRPYGSFILLAVILLGNFTSIDVIGFIMTKPLSSLFYALIGG
jgi:Zn-dependent protease